MSVTESTRNLYMQLKLVWVCACAYLAVLYPLRILGLRRRIWRLRGVW